ncbi:hypothetical protein ACPOL_1720 [Acidisarcina polymorpha]|uniref:Uncharacterized protein n=1 Tax=Acidisarcina polymorpha TaxID=2211140 RepID=A0A2Z5FWC4_9BACT|nr:hypothetical protein ACPOL_1720 [Acidisarcina polymorpha]
MRACSLHSAGAACPTGTNDETMLTSFVSRNPGASGRTNARHESSEVIEKKQRRIKILAAGAMFTRTEN